MERNSFAHLSHRLWMCDYERVEDHGAYADVISRLHQMSEQSLPISGIIDVVGNARYGQALLGHLVEAADDVGVGTVVLYSLIVAHPKSMAEMRKRIALHLD